MLKTAITRQLLSPSSQPLATCLLCQWRTFSTTNPRLASNKSKRKGKPAQVKAPEAQPTPSSVPKAAAPEAPETPGESKAGDATTPSPNPLKPAIPTPLPGPLQNAPRSYGKRVDEFTPTVLSRPIGMPFPPNPGENTGVDVRTLRQRRNDLVDWEKHLKRRQELKHKMARPYFRDWSNLSNHKGKTFLAPPRPFKSDLSLYFPNLYGETLSKTDKSPRDTTPTLEGKVSIVTMYSSMWAQNQAQTFVSKEANPALHEILDANKGKAQLVRINFEEDTLKYWLLKWFLGGIRKTVGKENWDKYFIVRKGISDEIRECIGLLNSKVGYTYLVDGECRIRWAGCGDSQADEKDGLLKGVNRLLDEQAKGFWAPPPNRDELTAKPDV